MVIKPTYKIYLKIYLIHILIMSDKLVFDLSQEVEGSPNVFVRKDWVNILDNANQNYNANQSVIDTSQLSNSNKYMAYREAYACVPLLLTIGSGKGDQTLKQRTMQEIVHSQHKLSVSLVSPDLSVPVRQHQKVLIALSDLKIGSDKLFTV